VQVLDFTSRRSADAANTPVAQTCHAGFARGYCAPARRENEIRLRLDEIERRLSDSGAPATSTPPASVPDAARQSEPAPVDTERAEQLRAERITESVTTDTGLRVPDR
jgi:hypothetical protein